MSEELQAAVRELAQLRQSEAFAQAAEQEALAQVESTDLYREYAALKAYRASVAADKAATEQRVRALTIEAFKATGDKNPTPYTSVRLYKRLVYDRDAVLIWCKEYAPTFVVESVDTKRFEKVAEDLINAPVTVEMDPRPTIATDLSGLEEPAE